MYPKHSRRLIIAIILTIFPLSAYGGGHEDCNICHEDTEEYALIVKPGSEIINPTTRKPYGKVDRLCVSCHEFHSKSSHPVGIVPNPERVDVPKEALGFKGQEGRISCMSCHNPHPKNTNYKYLRWPPENVWNLARFCTNCHTSQGAPERKEYTRISKR